jgi:hypothetical protein
LPSFRDVTRKELYDLVWSRPMRDVAVEFGISDVGLGKTCARYGIPKPPRGYWARLQAGQNVQQQALSRSVEAETQSIRIYSTTSRIPEAARQVLAAAKGQDGRSEIDAAKLPEPPDPFPVVDLYKPIKLTALTLRKSKPAPDGVVRAIDEGMHGIVISKDQIERAVFIIDGLVRRLEKEGLTVVAEGKAARVSSGSDDFCFTLAERTRREHHVPTPDEQKADAQRKKKLEGRWKRSDPWAGVGLSDFQKTYADWDTIYTGELVLQIDGYGAHGARKRWADGRTQKVERMLDEIVLGMRAYIAAAKAEREERDERERQRQHLQRRREKARLRRERETKRLEFLANLADQQRELARLTDWLATSLGQDSSTNLTRMNEWVRDRLATLQSALEPTGLEASLQKQQLFPDIDPLHDPEGEPPKDPYSY